MYPLLCVMVRLGSFASDDRSEDQLEQLCAAFKLSTVDYFYPLFLGPRAVIEVNYDMYFFEILKAQKDKSNQLSTFPGL